MRTARAHGLLGAILVLAYVAFERSLPRGAQEFAYYPFRPDGLPFSPMRGFTLEQLARHAGALGLLLPGFWLLARALAERSPRWLGRLRMTPRGALFACALPLGASAALLFGVFRGRAFTDDELAYALQARLLAEGRLADPSLPRLPHDAHLVMTRLGLTGKYLFGEPLLQLPGTLVDLPALLHLPLSALSVWLLYLAVRREAGARVARWAALFLAVSPMLMLTTASGLSNPSALFCLALAGYGVSLCRHAAPLRGALWLGLGLGFGLAVRPQSVAPGGLALAAIALHALYVGHARVAAPPAARRRMLAGALLVLLVAAGLSAIALYNRALSGSPWTLPWGLTERVERYGFGQVWEGVAFEHGPVTALQNLLVTAVRFNAWWLGWPASLAVAVLWWRIGRPTAGLKPWLWMAAAIVIFHLGYYSTGVSDTGPVYFYALLLPGAVLAAHVACAALDRAPRLAAAALAVHLGLATPGFVLEQGARLHRMMTSVHGPVERALSAVKAPAVLVVESNPDEILHGAWIHAAFPQRRYDDAAPIVTPTRWSQPPEGLRADLGFMAWIAQRWPGRACYYYRFDRTAGRRVVEPCAQARALMSRPVDLTRPALIVQSTAQRWGLSP